MNFLKIVFLSFLLVFQYFNINAVDTKKCTVKLIKLSDTSIFEVDTGTVINEEFLCQYKPITQQKDKVFSHWLISGVDSDSAARNTSDTVRITAVWMNITDVLAKQDSAMWNRFFEQQVRELVEGELSRIKYMQRLFFLIVIIIGGGAVVLSIILYKKVMRHLQGEIKKIREELNAIQPQTPSLIAMLPDIYGDLPRQIEELREQLETLKKEEPRKSESPIVMGENLVMPIRLYAKSIIKGKFYSVYESPTGDSIFELKLDSRFATTAKVTVYKQAYETVIVNPAFLEGCSRQIVGSSIVDVTEEGRAEKDHEGNWISVSPIKVVIR